MKVLENENEGLHAEVLVALIPTVQTIWESELQFSRNIQKKN